MKKIVMILVIFIAGLGYSQNANPVLEVEGQLVKAVYHYDNGAVQQIGYFKDGKLEGKWTSYDRNGNIQTVATYQNGEKVGKWMYYSNTVCTKEVDYSDNRVAAVKNLNQRAIADKY